MKKCSIGGQAVIEGVMMRSNKTMAITVRKPNNELESKVSPVAPNSVGKIPIVRGVANMVDMLKSGMDTIAWSASIAGEIEEEPTAFEKKLAKLTGKKVEDIAIGIGIVLGLVLFVGLFILLPQFVVGLFNDGMSTIASNLLEGLVRIIIFILYLFLMSLLKDIKRVFMYHGAEHKVIACYEHEEELTPENAAKFKRMHPRCGTAFLLIVMVISIIVYAVFDFGFPWWGKLLTRIALLPIVAGVSYEFLKLAAKSDMWLFRALRWPGLQLQRLTTKEPTADMLEVAIHSFNLVLETDNKAEDGNCECCSDCAENVCVEEETVTVSEDTTQETGINEAVE